MSLPSPLLLSQTRSNTETQPAQKPSTSSTSTSATAPSCSSRRSDGAASSANSSPTCKKKASGSKIKRRTPLPPSIHTTIISNTQRERGGGTQKAPPAHCATVNGAWPPSHVFLGNVAVASHSVSFAGNGKRGKQAEGGSLVHGVSKAACRAWLAGKGREGTTVHTGVQVYAGVGMCVCGRFLLFWRVLFLVWLRLNGACSTDGGSGLNDDAPLLSHCFAKSRVRRNTDSLGTR